MEDKLPNLFIVGAAKSGTTSIYKYLKNSKDIFFPEIKEPKYISSIITTFPFNGPGDREVEKKIIKSLNGYKNLFLTKDKFKYYGDASADNLYYHDKVIPVMKKLFDKKIHILILLRNPIDRAYSCFTHLVRDNREFLSFENALRDENLRISKNWEFIWHYRNAGMYYYQVKSYLKNFDSVKICLFNELQNDANNVVKEICNFLDIDFNFKFENIKYNVSGVPRIKFIHDFLSKKNRIKRYIKPIAKHILNANQRTDAVRFMKNKNLLKIPVKEETREHLAKIFYEDIMKLQELIGRDLTRWVN